MDIVDGLRSADAPVIVDALYVLGAKNKGAITPEIDEALIRLVDHDDPDVREAVAAAAGIRLKLTHFYPLFLRQLNGFEKSTSVLPPLIDATATLLLHGAGNIREVSIIFGRYILDDLEEDEVRGTAYLALLKVWKKISPGEYAAAPHALSEMKWDRRLVLSLVDSNHA